MAATILFTTEDVRKQAPIASGVVSRLDDMFAPWISSVSNQIRGFCNRKFDEAAYTIYRMSPDSFINQEPYRFRLPEWPVVSNTLFVSYDPSGQFIPNVSLPALLTEGVEYTIEYDTGWIEIISYGLCFHPRGLKVEWTGGYSVTDNVVAVPDEVKVAGALQVAFILDRITKTQLGQSSEKGNRGGNTHQFTFDAQTGLIAEVQIALYDYKVPLIGRT